MSNFAREALQHGVSLDSAARTFLEAKGESDSSVTFLSEGNEWHTDVRDTIDTPSQESATARQRLRRVGSWTLNHLDPPNVYNKTLTAKRTQLTTGEAVSLRASHGTGIEHSRSRFTLKESTAPYDVTVHFFNDRDEATRRSWSSSSLYQGQVRPDEILDEFMSLSLDDLVHSGERSQAWKKAKFTEMARLIKKVSSYHNRPETDGTRYLFNIGGGQVATITGRDTFAEEISLGRDSSPVDATSFEMVITTPINLIGDGFDTYSLRGSQVNAGHTTPAGTQQTTRYFIGAYRHHIDRNGALLDLPFSDESGMESLFAIASTLSARPEAALIADNKLLSYQVADDILGVGAEEQALNQPLIPIDLSTLRVR